MRFAISPEAVADVSKAFAALSGTSFWVVLVAKPKSRRKSALATE
jgi:hypothetical protein